MLCLGGEGGEGEGGREREEGEGGEERWGGGARGAGGGAHVRVRACVRAGVRACTRRLTGPLLPNANFASGRSEVMHSRSCVSTRCTQVERHRGR
jgi:hypothetical protein